MRALFTAPYLLCRHLAGRYMLIAGTLVVSLFLVACSSCKQTEPQKAGTEPIAVAAKPVPSGPVREISASSGGGFTGAVQGFTLRSDGLLTSWTRMPLGKEIVEKSTTVASESADSIMIAFRQNPGFGLTLKMHENVTKYLSYRDQDTTRQWSWVAEEDGTGDAAKLQTAYRAFMRFCNAALKTGNE